MPFKETGKEKEKREAYYKANKEKGIRAEKQRDYEMFGTTEQNIPNVNPMGDAVTSSVGMKKGGKVKQPTMTYQTYTKTGKEAGMKTIPVSGMKKGGSASKRADGIAMKGKTKGKIC